MMRPSLLLSQVLLYLPGTFLCYPWKPLVNLAVGDSFASAYGHFRRDHATPLNLALHFVCLVGQLVANFGVLAVLDAQYVGPLLGVAPGGLRVASAVTAIMWVATLLFCPVPLSVKLFSAVAVLAAFAQAPAIHAFGGADVALVGAFAAVCVLQSLVAVLKGSEGTRVWPRARSLLAKAFGGYLAMQWAVHKYVPSLAGDPTALLYANAAALAVMSVAAASREPAKATALAGTFLVHAVAIATRQDMLYFYSLAFVFQVSQGVAHRISGEQATLLQLNATTGKGATDEQDRQRLAFEWAHVTYFPALLVLSIHQSAFGNDSHQKQAGAAQKAHAK